MIPGTSIEAVRQRLVEVVNDPAVSVTAGLSGIFGDPDGGGVHGLNERIRVTSLLDARAYLYTLVKRYAR